MPSASLFLMLLLCSDFAFFALHSVVKLSPNVDNLLYYIDIDRSYAEMFQYLEWFWVIALLVSLSLKKKSLNYIAWALVFTYILLDDSVQIHETFGKSLADSIDIKPLFGLRPQDIGELLVTGLAGIILLPLVLWSYIKGSATFKKMSHDILLLIFALFFFGILIDMLHVALHSGKTLNALMAFFEDGGEMIVASLICWYIFLLCVRDANETAHLTDFITARIQKLRN